MVRAIASRGAAEDLNWVGILPARTMALVRRNIVGGVGALLVFCGEARGL